MTNWKYSSTFFQLVIVSPDAGGVAGARRVADKVHAKSVVTILKRRISANVVEEMQVVGDIQDTICVIVDDMIDTGGLLFFKNYYLNHFILILLPS